MKGVLDFIFQLAIFEKASGDGELGLEYFKRDGFGAVSKFRVGSEMVNIVGKESHRGIAIFAKVLKYRVKSLGKHIKWLKLNWNTKAVFFI